MINAGSDIPTRVDLESRKMSLDGFLDINRPSGIFVTSLLTCDLKKWDTRMSKNWIEVVLKNST